MLRMQEMTFPGFKFQKCSGGVHPQTPPPIHARYIGHTRGFQPLLSPSNILSHRKVPFQKMPPHGKILKKGPGPYRPDAIGQRDANFQFSMTFNFNIFQCFSNIRNHLSNFSYLVCISCKIFIR